MSVGRWCARVYRERGAWRCVAALSCGALVLLLARCSADLQLSEEFPHAPPHALAHLLADFTYQPAVGAWRVVEDGGNYTTWRYAVTFECDGACAGHARVEAHAAPEHARPTHGARASHHQVTEHIYTCTNNVLLAWLIPCDETETVWTVRAAEGAAEGAAGGARVSAAARARCPALSACAARLRAHLHHRLRLVRDALHRTPRLARA